LVHPGHAAGPHLACSLPAAELSWEKTAAVAVKIKLKRMGKIRAPFYRIIVADARTKRDGRAIEEIGKYHPKAEPSFIEVNSERAQHWLSVGAQPTDPVRRILEITGDWQKFKGLPGTEGTLKTAEAKADKKEAFAAAVAETLKAADAKPDKGRARKPAATADTAKADTAKADTAKAKDTKAASGKAAKTDGKRSGTGKAAKGADAAAGGAAAKGATASAASATAEDGATAEDATAPAGDSVAPAEGSAAPAGDSAAPAEDSAAPAGDSAASADDTAAPAEDTASAGGKQDSEA
jgi:small subunit ribosomal protein S16